MIISNLKRNTDAKVGDSIYLTKPLGVGILSTAQKMKKIDYRVKRMREIYNIYYNNLKEFIEIKPPLSDEWIPWFVDIYTDNRDILVDFLKKHNICSRPTYGEINKTNIYHSEINYKNSNYVSNKGLFLPSYITLTNKEINYICDILKLFFTQFA